MGTSEPPLVVWQPGSAGISPLGLDAMTGFREWLNDEFRLDLADYRQLHQFSVESPEKFWAALSDYAGVLWRQKPTDVLSSRNFLDARWFSGGTLNYAEHALKGGVAGSIKDNQELAAICHREDGVIDYVTFGELRADVAAARSALSSLGVMKGDRVAALLPNGRAALVSFLAAASLGAVWSSCSPDFGVRAIVDRFSQLEPQVLITVNGYLYNGKTFDISSTVDSLTDHIASLRTTIAVNYVESSGDISGALDWDSLLAKHSGAELTFEPVDSQHPLWVLYSSGTTGLPKGIVQGHCGIVLEHVKFLSLHCDLRAGEKFFWFTTTGWMMWNLTVSALIVGATIVLYDGSPQYPDISALWDLADEHEIDYFGVSAPFIHACMKAELKLQPKRRPPMRAIGSTGAPLNTDGFRWLADELGSPQICSLSGGTDVCTAFIGPSPDVPVWLGELSCASLGADIAAYDDNGVPVVNQVGELVLRLPMPSMPLRLWNDPNGDKLRESYFDSYPGVWRHGDWVEITDRGSVVIYGRSDSTLNRGGVRMGTAEFYRVIEEFDDVLDSLVIDTSGTSASGKPGAFTPGELLCFVVLAPNVELTALEPRLRAQLRRELSPRHVPDRFFSVPEIPRTLNGKKCEVPVKKILTGTPVGQAVSKDALSNPESLRSFVAYAVNGK